MKKVLLFSAALQKDAQAHLKDNSYGLGLAYLHAVIEKAGYAVTTKNFNNCDMAAAELEMAADLERSRPDFLLIQIFTMNRVASYRLVKLARKLLPDVKIIAGGVHASIFYKQLLENFEIDCVVIGEGEVTIIELLAALAAGGTAAGIKGSAYKENGSVVINPDRPLIMDLDALPFPRHDLFIQPDREMACVLTTRGCPFRCSFCCLHTISRRKFRKRSVANVIAEVEYILENFRNINTIQLADDTFTLDQPRAIEFCKEVIRRNIKVKFLCSARIKPASVELFRLMEQAGFAGIGFGLETGSAKLLQSIHKNITREDVIDTFKMLKGSRMKIVTYLMVGFPGENKETLSETIDLIGKLREIKYFEFAGVAKLWVYPNTEVYEIMKAAGRINDAFWLTDRDVPFFTLEHADDELEKMVTRITLACMPWRQGVRQFFGELLHPAQTVKKIIPRLRRLSQILPPANEQYLLVGAGRILQILIALVSMRVMTHMLSGAEVGNLYLILSLAAYFSLVFVSPVGMYINRHLNKWHKEGVLLEFFACYNVYVVLVSVLSFPLLYAAKTMFGIGTDIGAVALCSAAAGFIYFGTWNSTVIPALNMLNYRKSFVALSAGTLLLALAASILLIKFWRPSAVLWILGQIAALFAGAAAGFLYLVRRLKERPDAANIWARIKSPSLGSVIKFSLPLLVAAFFMWLQNQSYRLVVEKYLGLDFLGGIAVGLGIAAAVVAAAESIVLQIYYPLYYSEINTSDAEKRKFAWNKMARVMIPLYFLLALFVTFLSRHLVVLLVDVKFHSAWVFAVFGAWVEFARVTTNLLAAVAHSEMRTDSLTGPYIYGGVCTVAGVFLAANSAGYTYMVPAALVLGGASTLLLMANSMRGVMRFNIPRASLRSALLLALPFPLALLIKNQSGSLPLSFIVLIVFGGYMLAGQYLLYRKYAGRELRP